jgi:hypothetical protein
MSFFIACVPQQVWPKSCPTSESVVVLPQKVWPRSCPTLESVAQVMPYLRKCGPGHVLTRKVRPRSCPTSESVAQIMSYLRKCGPGHVLPQKVWPRSCPTVHKHVLSRSRCMSALECVAQVISCFRMRFHVMSYHSMFCPWHVLPELVVPRSCPTLEHVILGMSMSLKILPDHAQNRSCPTLSRLWPT